MSNFFCVQGDTLHTAGTGVLGGITRETLLVCAAELGLQVVEEAVHQNQVNRMNEAFLSSSVRGVLPVVRFAGKDIGNGQPGPRTLALDAAYGELVRSSARSALPSDESP
jgi:branched-subunit amino acid aminotransferase/4-amino-4-deoxychorismate lyase